MASAAPPKQQAGRYEALIDQRLQQTRRQVTGVDLAAGLITLVAGVLAYLLAAAVIDHWLLTGGLGFWGRVVLSLGLLGGGGYYFARHVLPPLVRRINPVFAAYTIEKSQPALKNSVINFLLLRGHPQEVPPVVYRALEQQAAADLKDVSVETAVDRTHVIHLGYMLAGLVLAFALYVVISPKSPLVSAARIVWPWAALESPTRVTINEIEPGDTTLFYGDQATVSARVHGVKEGEPVTLFYTTADGQIVDQPLAMAQAAGDYRYCATLPPGGLGLQQDVEYHLAAGDYVTRPFHIAAQVAPAIVVDDVHYDYPAYTGIAPQTIEHQGDIRALEGARATIRATANTDIQHAEIDLDCNGLHTVKMEVNGRRAVGRVTLRLTQDEALRPEHDAYQLRFTDREGRENRRPIRYRIEVIRDLPPEVRVLEPSPEEVQVVEDGQLEIRVQAEDPDFGLRRVALLAEHGNRKLPLAVALDRPRPQAPHQGPLAATYRFSPARLGLKAGDRVRYWAEAEDNKEPTPGHAESQRRWINVVAVGPQQLAQNQQPHRANRDQNPQNPPPQGEQANQPPNDQQEPQNEPPKPGENKEPKPGEKQPQPPDQRQPGEKQDQGEKPQDQASGQQQGGEPGAKDGTSQGGKPDAGKGGQKQDGSAESSAEKSNQPVDGKTNPGDVFDEVLKRRQEQQPEQQGNQPKQDGNQPQNQQQPGEKQEGQKPGQQQQPGGDQGKQPGQQQQPGGDQGKQPGQQQQPGGDQGKQPGQQQQPGGGEQPAAKQQPGGGPQPGNQQKPGGGDQGKQPGQQQENGQKGHTSGDDQAGNPQMGQKREPGQEAAPGPGQKEQPGAQQQNGNPPPGGQPQKSGSREGGADQPQGQKPEPSGGEPGEKSTGPGKQPDAQTPQSEGPNERGQQPNPAADPNGAKKPGGGEPQEGQQKAGAGKQGDSSGSPAPQEGNQSHPKNPGEANPGQQQQQQDGGQSPTTSPKQSDSQGGQGGDKSGGGEQGGGQQAKKPGVGAPGSQTDAESGGSKSQQQGPGETGTQAGQQAKSDHPTGSSARQSGKGAGDDRREAGSDGPGKNAEKQSTSSAPGKPQEHPTDGGRPGQQTSKGPGAHGTADNPTTGGGPDQGLKGAPESNADEPGGDDPNLQYSRKATDLALDYLKDQLAKEKPDPKLLDRLGWTREELARFAERWEQMKRAAAGQGPQAKAAKAQLDEALKSLGLRRHGTELRGGTTATDKLENLRESGRFQPPAQWAEQFREFTRGVAGGQRSGTP